MARLRRIKEQQANGQDVLPFMDVNNWGRLAADVANDQSIIELNTRRPDPAQLQQASAVLPGSSNDPLDILKWAGGVRRWCSRHDAWIHSQDTPRQRPWPTPMSTRSGSRIIHRCRIGGFSRRRYQTLIGDNGRGIGDADRLVVDRHPPYLIFSQSA